MRLEVLVRGMVATWVCCLAGGAFAQAIPRKTLTGHVPFVVTHLASKGVLPPDTKLSLAIGLPLRNRAGLNQLLGELYNPASPNFRKFITPEEFTARFGPTEADYEAVQAFARANGFVITTRHDNRLVLDVDAPAVAVERAFHVKLRTYHHPAEARDFFAPDTEPSVPLDLPVADVWGLSDYGRPKPLSRKLEGLPVRPLGGSGPSGYYAGDDFRRAYVPGTALTGAGQSVGLLQFSAYYKADITNYQNTIGRTNYVQLTDVVVGHPGPGTANNSEVALDIEMAIAMAPELSQVIVYQIKSINPSSILNRMATDNLAKQLSSSWSWTGGPSTTIDSIFQQMAAQGQSFFQASGDSDAYTGGQALDNSSQTTAPVDSPYVTSVGGTTLTMSGAGTGWYSERVWNYNPFGGSFANVGSGGGISTYYSIPDWQANVSMAGNAGSTVWRNIPDVALTGDSVYVAYNNGSSGGFAGTSCAAPLWAGLCALVNQQSVAASGTTVGFLNPSLYAIAAGGNYASCFHDITTGDNIGTNTPGLFRAVAGYDLCSGLGTPNGTALINALAPSPPVLLTQPVGQTVPGGANVSFSATAGGSLPHAYRWLFNGTNLPAGGNVAGVTSNVLSITSATLANSGSYQLLVTNTFGAVTSSVATLNVGLPPSITAQPASQIVPPGSNVVFSATVTGSTPLTFQWRKDGNKLSDGPGISGATSSRLTLSGVSTNSVGGYALFVTNLYGATTSSVAMLTMALPPSLTGSLSNRTVECGSNIVSFAITASGTPPFGYQWSLDALPVANATNSAFSITNLVQPDHTVGVVVTNLYGSAGSNAFISVVDTRGPEITLNGPNPSFVELGTAFAEPGAVANDACAGGVPVSITGTVNINAVGTNTVVYAAGDAVGNTNSVTRSVIVRDTTPPVITWAFTNLILVADTNCSVWLPDLTGTNYLAASDLSEPLTITENPTNGSLLTAGTNLLVLTVADAFGNAAYSTNTVVVQDETPPVIVLNGQNPLTVFVGESYNEPGAQAVDACAGPVPVTIGGTVDTSTAGTNTVDYLAVDPGGNSNAVSRTVIVTINTTPAITGVATSPNGGIALKLSGAPGFTYVLEITSDLATPASWQPVATNTLDSTGMWEFTDTQANTVAQRFYRLMLTP